MKSELDENLKNTLEKLDLLAEQLRNDKDLLSQNASVFLLKELLKEQKPDEGPRHSASAIR